MYSIKLFLLNRCCDSSHSKACQTCVRNDIFSVCVCVCFVIQLLSVLWASEFTVLSCIFRLMHFANNSLFKFVL